MTHIAIIDYGIGNLRSVAKAFEKVAPTAKVTISNTAEEIETADRIVFPGQGAIGDCMKFFEASGLRHTVLNAIQNKPTFGICVGEQMLFEFSEEGDVESLGIFKGQTKRFPFGLTSSSNHAEYIGQHLKVPHMGWNQVKQSKNHTLWNNIPDNSFFYFAHSYFVHPNDESITFGETHYGLNFTSVIARDNIFATQFHPEKSAKYGLQLFANFANWQP